MEKLSRSISRSLSRSVSSSLDVNRLWKRRAYDRFDGQRSMRNAQLGEKQGMLLRFKNMFNFSRSKQIGAKKSSKARRASIAAEFDNEFQNRILSVIYNTQQPSRELGPL
ncbi:hypothetical protein CTI12_AA028840 [Artemisia annua]|uniref:Uncharacterized protein n=1 Tax=Artemisia annua TaxID=35608 RepID=A0A2U1QHM5_ARTAN|nr:hypothetical protein CTI12_AA028840 [Artemisia annua]